MPLLLKIVSLNRQPYTGEEVIIAEGGGSIGRSETNTLILADESKTVSRCHATIEFLNGQYKLIDNSLAGTFIDDIKKPINHESLPLTDGMHIKIGDYVIICSLKDQDLSSPSLDPFSDSNLENISSQTENSLLGVSEEIYTNPFLNQSQDHDFSKDLDLLTPIESETGPDLLNDSENNSLLDQVIDNNESSPFSGNGLLDTLPTGSHDNMEQGLMAENISSLNDSFKPAEPVENNLLESTGEIPDDFNFEDLFKLDEENSEDNLGLKLDVAESFVELVETEELAKQSPIASQVTNTPEHVEELVEPLPKVEQNQLLSGFLKGAKLDGNDFNFDDPVEKITQIGTMFRAFVENTVSVLRSRAEFKSLFRVTVTTIQRADNNPLKFAVTTDDALKHLIADGESGFKPSIDSINEGFSDLMNHQLAMQAGIQASLTDILRQFDPATIEDYYKEGIVLQKKSKCWEHYSDVYSKLSETAVNDFFGDAFSDAYEMQMRQLKK